MNGQTCYEFNDDKNFKSIDDLILYIKRIYDKHQPKENQTLTNINIEGCLRIYYKKEEK